MKGHEMLRTRAPFGCRSDPGYLKLQLSGHRRIYRNKWIQCEIRWRGGERWCFVLVSYHATKQVGTCLISWRWLRHGTKDEQSSRTENRPVRKTNFVLPRGCHKCPLFVFSERRPTACVPPCLRRLSICVRFGPRRFG